MLTMRLPVFIIALLATAVRARRLSQDDASEIDPRQLGLAPPEPVKCELPAALHACSPSVPCLVRAHLYTYAGLPDCLYHPERFAKRLVKSIVVVSLLADEQLSYLFLKKPAAD